MTAAASDVSSATSAVEALTATTNSAETTPTIASALASFKFGPEEAAKPTMDGDAALIKPLKDAAEAVESVPMDLESSLNQSALKMLQMDYHSDFDSVEDLEDGEVRDKAKLPPPSSTSTPIDLAKSPENKKHQAHGLARKKLELSPPPSPNKVCLNLSTMQDGLAASDREAVSVQTASKREATGTDLKGGLAARPKRKCAMNKYFIENYVLDTKTVQSMIYDPKPALAFERPIASKKRLDKAQVKVKSPSITPFLKPIVASPEGIKVGSKNEVGEHKEAPTKSQTDSLVSQKLMSDFFPKN